MKNEYLEELASILGSTSSLKSETGSALFSLIEKAKDDGEHIKLLEIALVKRESFPDTKQPIEINIDSNVEDKWDELNQYHLEVIMSHLKLAFVQSDSIEKFSKKCFGIIELFDDVDEKIFALSSILYSPYIPYRQIVGSLKSVSSKEYNELLIKNQEFADDIIYVEKLPFEDLPSECLNVLNVLNKTADDKLKVALLSLYASNLIRRYKDKS